MRIALVFSSRVSVPCCNLLPSDRSAGQSRSWSQVGRSSTAAKCPASVMRDGDQFPLEKRRMGKTYALREINRPEIPCGLNAAQEEAQPVKSRQRAIKEDRRRGKPVPDSRRVDPETRNGIELRRGTLEILRKVCLIVTTAASVKTSSRECRLRERFRSCRRFRNSGLPGSERSPAAVCRSAVR